MSTIACASFRMEPGYMIAGHAVGAAAALASRERVPVQSLPIAELQTQLKQQGQIVAH